MSEGEELQGFYEEQLATVAERSQGATTRQEAFTQTVLDDLVESGTVNDPEICFLRRKLGRGLARVTAYAISEEEARLDLFTTIFSENPALPSLTQKEMVEAYVQASRVFVFSKGNGFEEMDPASGQRLMVERLHSCYDDISSLRIFLLTNARAPDMGKHPEIAGIEVPASVECFDIVRQFRWRNAGTPSEAITINLDEHACGPVPCLRMPASESEYGAFLAILPGSLLFETYEKYGARLMELNVRSFLQNRGGVNKGIRETILKEPERFLAYNNGISATAEDLVTIDTAKGCAIQILRGLQVVNGGQTVASIHRAAKVDRADLSKIFVQAKISVVPPELVEGLVPQISRFANTQNKVNEADFSANNPFHVEMEKLSRRVWTPGEQSRWFYERARGQYEVQRNREGTTPAKRKQFDTQNPKRQKFTKTDLARYLNAWDEKPHAVSLGAQKNFVEFVAEIAKRPGSWLPDQEYFKQAVAKAIVFRAAESIGSKLAFPAYRANAVCYTVSYLAYRTARQLDLNEVWEKQRLSDAVQAHLSSWMRPIHEEIVRSANGKNVTEWAKKAACWHAVQRLELELSDLLESEFTSSASAPRPDVAPEPDPASPDNIMEVDAASWLSLFGWGKRTGILTEHETTAAEALARYASTGWQTLPSRDECIAGNRILGLARTEGVIEKSPT